MNELPDNKTTKTFLESIITSIRTVLQALKQADLLQGLWIIDVPLFYLRSKLWMHTFQLTSV